MKHSIYFTDNSQETLDKLESLGFYICPCYKFYNTKWIHFYYRTIDSIKGFHGTGYQCEVQCKGTDEPDSNKCVVCAIRENIAYKRNIHIFSDINELVQFINENYK